MSLAAIDNVCSGGIFRERMSRIPELACAETLTDERIPVGSLAPRVESIKTRVRRGSRTRECLPELPAGIRRASLVSDGAMHICLCSDGCAELRYGRLPLCGTISVRNDISLARISGGADSGNMGEKSGVDIDTEYASPGG